MGGVDPETVRQCRFADSGAAWFDFLATRVEEAAATAAAQPQQRRQQQYEDEGTGAGADEEGEDDEDDSRLPPMLSDGVMRAEEDGGEDGEEDGKEDEEEDEGEGEEEEPQREEGQWREQARAVTIFAAELGFDLRTMVKTAQLVRSQHSNFLRLPVEANVRSLTALLGFR